MKGRTTRLILEALIKLSEGHNIVFVAHPRERAVRICRRAVSIAKGLKIPCSNIASTADGGDPGAPYIRPRGLDDIVPLPTPDACVFIDHSASHERGCVREPAERTVITANNLIEDRS